MLRPTPSSTLFPYTTLFRSAFAVVRSTGGRLRHGSLAAGRFARAMIEQYSLFDEDLQPLDAGDRKSTRLNSSHLGISYAVFCLKKKTIKIRVKFLAVTNKI